VCIGWVGGWTTVFERCYAFESDAKVVWIEESGWVVEEFYVLGGVIERRKMVWSRRTLMVTIDIFEGEERMG
jgi:hypothetical protein